MLSNSSKFGNQDRPVQGKLGSRETAFLSFERQSYLSKLNYCANQIGNLPNRQKAAQPLSLCGCYLSAHLSPQWSLYLSPFNKSAQIRRDAHHQKGSAPDYSSVSLICFLWSSIEVCSKVQIINLRVMYWHQLVTFLLVVSIQRIFGQFNPCQGF